jgi:sugar lactone lactonase YvrE
MATALTVTSFAATVLPARAGASATTTAGQLSILPGLALNYPDALVSDQAGDLYVGDTDTNSTTAPNMVYKVRPDGTSTVAVEGAHG